MLFSDENIGRYKSDGLLATDTTLNLTRASSVGVWCLAGEDNQGPKPSAKASRWTESPRFSDSSIGACRSKLPNFHSKQQQSSVLIPHSTQQIRALTYLTILGYLVKHWLSFLFILELVENPQNVFMLEFDQSPQLAFSDQIVAVLPRSAHGRKATFWKFLTWQRIKPWKNTIRVQVDGELFFSLFRVLWHRSRLILAV